MCLTGRFPEAPAQARAGTVKITPYVSITVIQEVREIISRVTEKFFTV